MKSFNVGETLLLHWKATGEYVPVNYRGILDTYLRTAVVVKDGMQMVVDMRNLKRENE